jgi:antitoxin (DNA-binding transcriptional repressor) of toxin-antitoxin stability system
VSRVAKTHDKVTITKHGKPVAQLVPVEAAPESLFGYMKGTVTVKGNIVAPLTESWSVRDGDEDSLYTVELRTRPAKPKRKRT